MRILDFDIPILQAPIGSCTGVELASAVSQAGAMGALALTWTSPEVAGQMVSEVRKRTTKPFQVNFVLAFEPRSLVPALEAGAPIVTFSWGLPDRYVSVVRSHGAKFGVQVTTRDGAKRALDCGADFLICQGVEAGGHVQATQPLCQVLPEVVIEAGTVPVVAAGGIGSGAAIAAVLRMGATAAMLGTRFVACDESLAHSSYKQLLVESSAKTASLTLCFDLGWPYAAHRVLRNRTLELWEAAGCPPSGLRPGEGDVLAFLPNGKTYKRYEDAPPLRGMDGSVLELCLYAGLSVADVTDVRPAADLVAALWNECRMALNDG